MADCPTCGDEFKNNAGMKIHHKRIHGESLSGIKSTCETCGNEFRHAKTDSGRFCSRDCYGEYNSKAYTGEGNPNGCNRVTLTCPICEDKFQVVQSQSERRVCCSRKCMGEYRSKNYVGENHHKYKERKEVDCWTCGTSLTRQEYRFEYSNNHFCDHECYGAYVSEVQSGEDHYKYKPDELTEYGPGWDEEKRERIRARDNHECQGCGSKAKGHFDKLDVHHIQPADSFTDPEKRNAIENLISLCRSCHPKWEKMAPLRPDS